MNILLSYVLHSSNKILSSWFIENWIATFSTWMKKDSGIYCLQNILPMCPKKQHESPKRHCLSCPIVEGSQRLCFGMVRFIEDFILDLPLSFILFHYVYVLRMNRQNTATDPADINLQHLPCFGITLRYSKISSSIISYSLTRAIFLSSFLDHILTICSTWLN